MSYSGTPTVVWRRTGEICLVAPEFCMLTEWPLEDLVGNGRKKYIYEVRDLVRCHSHPPPFPAPLYFLSTRFYPCSNYNLAFFILFYSTHSIHSINPTPSPLSHVRPPPTAIRKPVRSRVLGKLCVARVREHDPVGVLALRAAQAQRRTGAVDVLLLNTAGPV